jgi:hypothetical protein
MGTGHNILLKLIELAHYFVSKKVLEATFFGQNRHPKKISA